MAYYAITHKLCNIKLIDNLEMNPFCVYWTTTIARQDHEMGPSVGLFYNIFVLISVDGKQMDWFDGLYKGV